MKTTVCDTCSGARWVSKTGDKPWHPGCGEPPGHPCPGCNVGPVYYPWNLRCLKCSTLEDFMSTLEPDDPDAVLAGMFAQLGDIEEPTAVDYSKLSEVELSDAFNEVRDRLIEIDQMQGEPRDDEGRDLHSRRAAMLIEMSRRGMR